MPRGRWRSTFLGAVLVVSVEPAPKLGAMHAETARGGRDVAALGAQRLRDGVVIRRRSGRRAQGRVALAVERRTGVRFHVLETERRGAFADRAERRAAHLRAQLAH